MKNDKANANPNVNFANAIIFHLLTQGVTFGGNSNVEVHVGSARLFRYQHVGIGNAKWLRWGPRPLGDPNANGFAFWCNISFDIKCIVPFLGCMV